MFRNHCFLLESSGDQQLEGNMFCPGAVGLLLSHSRLQSYAVYDLESVKHLVLFERRQKRGRCVQHDCLLVPEEQESDAEID